MNFTKPGLVRTAATTNTTAANNHKNADDTLPGSETITH